MRTKKNHVKSVLRAISILECYLDSDKLKFSDITKKTGLSNSTVSRLLTSLIEKDFLTKHNGDYSLGNIIFILGMTKLSNSIFSKQIHPTLQELASLSEETVNASILYYDGIIYIDKILGIHTLRSDIPIGKKAFFNTSASGKVMLANFKKEKIDEVLNNISLEQKTKNTITDKKLFLKELEKIKDSGYAIDNEEDEIGAKCVAGCVFNSNGDVAGAISISGFSERIDNNLEYFIKLIKKHCNEVSFKLGYRSKQYK